MKTGFLLPAACASGAALRLLFPLPRADTSGRDDRLSLMVAGHKLTNTDGGWGASAIWLHNFNANTLVGLGGETQEIKSDISDARWSFGKLTFNHGFGATETRTNVYADASIGSGRDDLHSYDYTIVTAGVFQNMTRQLSLQLENKYDRCRYGARRSAEACRAVPVVAAPLDFRGVRVFGQRQPRHAARDRAHRWIHEDDESVRGPRERPGRARRYRPAGGYARARVHPAPVLRRVRSCLLTCRHDDGPGLPEAR